MGKAKTNQEGYVDLYLNINHRDGRGQTVWKENTGKTEGWQRCDRREQVEIKSIKKVSVT